MFAVVLLQHVMTCSFNTAQSSLEQLDRHPFFRLVLRTLYPAVWDCLCCGGVSSRSLSTLSFFSASGYSNFTELGEICVQQLTFVTDVNKQVPLFLLSP